MSVSIAKRKHPTFVSDRINIAILENKETYYTGKPCKFGHLAERTIGRGVCVECEKNKKANHFKWMHQEDLEKRKSRLITQARQNAKYRGIPFEITKDDLVWPMNCPILGFEMDYFGKSGKKMKSPSLDRLDSSKPYIKGNVFVISNRANAYKSDATIEITEKLLQYMKGVI